MQVSPQRWLLCAATAVALPALVNAQITQEPSPDLPADPYLGDPVDPRPIKKSHLTWEAPEDGAIRAFPSQRSPIVETPIEAQQLISDAEFLEAYKSEAGNAPQDRMHYDLQNGTHWAMGLAYKASAGQKGFTYHPFLGSSAPKTYGVTMRLGSATLGGETIQLQDSISIARKADRITLDRGPIDVWYDMGLESVKQSFALEAAGIDAELVLTIDVSSDLAFEMQSGTVSYLNELGGVTYSHALVVDGAGHELALPIFAQADQITLTVPASYMKNSVAPVVVDPVIATYQVHPGYIRDLTEPDVAYDLTTNRFAFAHTSEWSATDFDVWLETRNPDTGALDSVESIDFTTLNYQTPMVANDNTSNQYLVTSRHLNASGFWEITGRTVDATDISQQSPVFMIADANSSWESGRHDLGGKSQGSPLFLSVWERTFSSSNYTNIRRRLITPVVPFSTVTAPSVSSVFAVSSSSLFDDSQVRVSESSGTAAVAEWRLVYIREEKATGDQDIDTLRINDDGTVVDTITSFAVSTTNDLQDIDVSTGLATMPGPNGGPTYATPMMFVPSVTPTIWVYAMDGDSLFAGTRIKISEHTNQDNRPRYPAVSASATRFNVTYVEFSTTSPSVYTCYSTAVDLTNTFAFGVNDRRVIVKELTQHDFKRPASASRYDGGNYTSRYVACAVTDYDGALNVQEAVTIFPNLPSTPGTQFCQGNPNSTGDYGFITMTGTASDSTTKELRASAMPFNQFGYFLAGQSASSITPPGSSGVFCVGGGAFGRYNQNIEVFFTATSGEAQLTIDPAAFRGPSGNVVATAGETWRFQAWHRENGGDSNFTNGIAVFLD